MAGVIRLSGPIPSVDTDDVNINISDEEREKEKEKDKDTDKQKDTKKNGFSRLPSRSFRNLKSRSAESPSDEDDHDTHSHSHSHSHHNMDTSHLPIFDGLKACYPLTQYKSDIKTVIKEIISGLIVSFAQVPESISFAMLANLPAIFGLHSAWLVGGIVGLTGGRPGMISGPTGGMGAILGPIMIDTNVGINYLPYIIMFSGILIVIAGILNIGKFAKLIPQTVMIGFLNGLAIIIFKSQYHLFDHAHDLLDYILAALLAIITFLVVQFLPKCTKKIPSSLAGIGVACLIEYLIIRMAIGHHTPLIGDLSEIKGELPKPFWQNDEFFNDLPSLSSQETWMNLMLPIILVTLVSIIEDQMTMDVVTELSHTKSYHLSRHTKQQEISMGIANIIGGLLSTMGGHGAIGLSMVSCHSGSSGRYRISSIIACISVFIIVMFASPIIDKVPAASLTGIMLAVVFHTFEWRSIPMVISAAIPRKIRKSKMYPKFMRQTKIRRGDAIVIVLVTIVVVVMNLVYAVLLGIVISCLIYTWYSGFDFHVHKEWVHRHHQKDRRFIKKFSDFHIHYDRKHRNGSRHGLHSREHSVETIDTMDPHYHGPPHYHPHDGYHRDHTEHSHISDHTHDIHPDHLHHENDDHRPFDRLSSFSKDNKFTELHEIKDIHHLDSFLHKEHHSVHTAHTVHMEPLKEGVDDNANNDNNDKNKDNNDNDENQPKALKHSMSAPINDIKDIHDTYNSKTHENPAIRPMPTFDIDGIEHGTLRFNRLDTFDCKLSDDGKLSDDTDDHHHNTHFEKLSDCTNPDDLGMKFNSDYILIYHFEGPLFFGNCRNLLNNFDPKNDPDQIEIHLRDACIYDFSAMNALNQVGEEYDKLGKTVHLRHINNKSHKLIAKAHHLVKYFSYDDQIKPFEPLNKNNMTNKSQSSLSRIRRYDYDNNHEREFSKSKQ